MSMQHVVIPGQIIAISTETDFLRGHGTFIETISNDDFESRFGYDMHCNKSSVITTMENQGLSNKKNEGEGEDEDICNAKDTRPTRLVASVAGTVERVNKLISVFPTGSLSYYAGQVGDLIIGRISAVGSTRWMVSLTGVGNKICKRNAHLPLNGVHLPDGVQRVRTSADALIMRDLFVEGDLVSAEVQKVQGSGEGGFGATGASSSGGGGSSDTLILHTRSLRYGKLENGCSIFVPPGLIRRMKQHFVTLGGGSYSSLSIDSHDPLINDDGFSGVSVDVLIGCNGGIWIQRAISSASTSSTVTSSGSGGGSTLPTIREEIGIPLAETLQKMRRRHANTSVLPDERQIITRVRNAIEALKMTSCCITPDHIMAVMNCSVGIPIKDMLNPEVIVQITACTRSQKM